MSTQSNEKKAIRLFFEILLCLLILFSSFAIKRIEHENVLEVLQNGSEKPSQSLTFSDLARDLEEEFTAKN